MFDKKDEFEIVKRLTGVNELNRIEINEVGWTSRVYIIDGGKIVFKFPRSAKFREECKYEVASQMIDVLNLIYCIENNFVDGVETIGKCLKRVKLRILK